MLQRDRLRCRSNRELDTATARQNKTASEENRARKKTAANATALEWSGDGEGTTMPKYAGSVANKKKKREQAGHNLVRLQEYLIHPAQMRTTETPSKRFRMPAVFTLNPTETVMAATTTKWNHQQEGSEV